MLSYCSRTERSQPLCDNYRAYQWKEHEKYCKLKRKDYKVLQKFQISLKIGKKKKKQRKYCEGGAFRRKPSLKEKHSSEGRWGRSAVLIIPLPRGASYRLWYYLQEAILGILRKSYLDIEKCALGQDPETCNLKKKALVRENSHEIPRSYFPSFLQKNSIHSQTYKPAHLN